MRRYIIFFPPPIASAKVPSIATKADHAVASNVGVASWYGSSWSPRSSVRLSLASLERAMCARLLAAVATLEKSSSGIKDTLA